MYSAISHNKRNTVLIMAVFVAIIGVIGVLVGMYLRNYSLSVVRCFMRGYNIISLVNWPWR